MSEIARRVGLRPSFLARSKREFRFAVPISSRNVSFFQARSADSSRRFSSIKTWLILPVAICLFLRLSHACVKIKFLSDESANGSLKQL